MPRSPMAAPTRRSLLLLGSLTGVGMLAGCVVIQQPNREPSEEPSPEPSRPLAKKPVLYLYPSTTTDLSVSLDYKGTLTYTYPTPQTQADGRVTWQVTASPNGDITDATGRHYPSLFWEGEEPTTFAQDEGFIVDADAATGFLEEKLSVLGLDQREAAEFITFWGPRVCARSDRTYRRRVRRNRTVELVDGSDLVSCCAGRWCVLDRGHRRWWWRRRR